MVWEVLVIDKTQHKISPKRVDSHILLQIINNIKFITNIVSILSPIYLPDIFQKDCLSSQLQLNSN